MNWGQPENATKNLETNTWQYSGFIPNLTYFDDISGDYGQVNRSYYTLSGTVPEYILSTTNLSGQDYKHLQMGWNAFNQTRNMYGLLAGQGPAGSYYQSDTGGPNYSDEWGMIDISVTGNVITGTSANYKWIEPSLFILQGPFGEPRFITKSERLSADFWRLTLHKPLPNYSGNCSGQYLNVIPNYKEYYTADLLWCEEIILENQKASGIELTKSDGSHGKAQVPFLGTSIIKSNFQVHNSLGKDITELVKNKFLIDNIGGVWISTLNLSGVPNSPFVIRYMVECIDQSKPWSGQISGSGVSGIQSRTGYPMNCVHDQYDYTGDYWNNTGYDDHHFCSKVSEQEITGYWISGEISGAIWNYVLNSGFTNKFLKSCCQTSCLSFSLAKGYNLNANDWNSAMMGRGVYIRQIDPGSSNPNNFRIGCHDTYGLFYATGEPSPESDGGGWAPTVNWIGNGAYFRRESYTGNPLDPTRSGETYFRLYTGPILLNQSGVLQQGRLELISGDEYSYVLGKTKSEYAYHKDFYDETLIDDGSWTYQLDCQEFRSLPTIPCNSHYDNPIGGSESQPQKLERTKLTIPVLEQTGLKTYNNLWYSWQNNGDLHIHISANGSGWTKGSATIHDYTLEGDILKVQFEKENVEVARITVPIGGGGGVTETNSFLSAGNVCPVPQEYHIYNEAAVRSIYELTENKLRRGDSLTFADGNKCTCIYSEAFAGDVDAGHGDGRWFPRVPSGYMSGYWWYSGIPDYNQTSGFVFNSEWYFDKYDIAYFDLTDNPLKDKINMEGLPSTEVSYGCFSQCPPRLWVNSGGTSGLTAHQIYLSGDAGLISYQSYDSCNGIIKVSSGTTGLSSTHSLGVYASGIDDLTAAPWIYTREASCPAELITESMYNAAGNLQWRYGQNPFGGNSLYLATSGQTSLAQGYKIHHANPEVVQKKLRLSEEWVPFGTPDVYSGNWCLGNSAFDGGWQIGINGFEPTVVSGSYTFEALKINPLDPYTSDMINYASIEVFIPHYQEWISSGFVDYVSGSVPYYWSSGWTKTSGSVRLAMMQITTPTTDLPQIISNVSFIGMSDPFEMKTDKWITADITNMIKLGCDKLIENVNSQLYWVLFPGETSPDILSITSYSDLFDTFILHALCDYGSDGNLRWQEYGYKGMAGAGIKFSNPQIQLNCDAIEAIAPPMIYTDHIHNHFPPLRV